MFTRPKVLLRDWYLYEVYDTIPHSLRGAQEWFSQSIAGARDRDEFEHTMLTCREMCARRELRYDAIAMKESLEALRFAVSSELGKNSSWSFFRPRSIFADGLTYRLKAVDLCIELVDGITKKYLMHS